MGARSGRSAIGCATLTTPSNVGTDERARPQVTAGRLASSGSESNSQAGHPSLRTTTGTHNLTTPSRHRRPPTWNDLAARPGNHRRPDSQRPAVTDQAAQPRLIGDRGLATGTGTFCVGQVKLSPVRTADPSR